MRIFDQTRQKGLLALLLCVAAVAIWPGIALAEGGKSSVTPPPPPVFQIQQDDACGHDPKITTAEAVLEECTRAIERGDLSDEELSRAYLIRVLALQALGWANNKEYESYNKSLHTDIDAALKLTPHSADANYFKCNHREFSERGDLKYCFEAIKYNKKHYEAHYEIGTNFQDEAQSLRLREDSKPVNILWDKLLPTNIKPMPKTIEEKPISEDEIGKKLNLAIEYLTNSINYAPESYFDAAYFWRANTYDQLKKYELAISDYTIKLNHELSYYKYLINLNNKNDAYEISNVKEYGLSSTYEYRAKDYYELQNYDQAIADYSESIANRKDVEYPYIARAYAGRAKSYWAIGDDENAIADLEAANRIDGPGTYSDAKNLLDLYRREIELHKKQLSASPITGKRVALVIGIGDYANIPLTNTVRDAQDVAAELKAEGFTVTLATSADQASRVKDAASLKALIKDFTDNTAPPSESVVIWFTGHGKALALKPDDPTSPRQDYILPSDYVLGDNPTEKGVNAEELMWAAAGAHKLGLVLVDACRSNASHDTFDSGFQTVGAVRPSKNGRSVRNDKLVVVYSAQPNHVSD